MILFISGAEIIFVFLVVLLVFGAKKVPDIAKTLGKSVQQVKNASKDFRKEIEKTASNKGIDTKEIVDEVQNIKTEINKIKNTVTRKR
jgi:sec-independent protein translocase protein TatA